MIQAPPGLVARVKQVRNGKPRFSTMPIVAFDDDGRPLVIDENEERNERSLVPASAFSNYAGMAHDPYPPLVALLPAGGWCVQWTSSGASEPLVGWGLKGDGTVVALATDRHGWVEDFDNVSDDTYCIYHPDATEAPSEGV